MLTLSVQKEGCSSGHGSQRGYRLALQPVFLGLLLILIFNHGSQTLAADNRDENKAEEYSRILKDLTLGYRDVDSASSSESPENGVHRRQYRDLHNSECSENATRIDAQCARVCQCIDGHWKCCRHRKSYEDLSEEEKKRLANAYVVASSDPRYKADFAAVLWAHSVFACQVVRRGNDVYPITVTFHRMLVFALENVLRRVDCRISMPFWDIPKLYPRQWVDQLPLLDKKIFGSNGVPPEYCVKDGMLAEGKYVVPILTYHGKEFPLESSCMRRKIDESKGPCPWPVIQAILAAPSKDSILLMAGLLGGFDVLFHYGIGGSFRDVSLPVDPIFAMAHSYIDKVIANYQARGPEFMTGNGYYNNTEALTAFPWFTARDFIDAGRLPGGVCLSWGASMPRDEALSTGYYAALEMPRKEHLYLRYSEIRDRRLFGGARSDNAFNTMLEYFRTHFPSFKFDANGFHVSDWQTYLHKYAFRPPNKNNHALDFCKRFLKLDPSFLSYNVTSPGMHPV
eukprot:scpid51010/ scgid13803/ 